MDTVILGKHNPRLLEVRRAINGDTLTEDGLLAVEGPRLIREAERSGLKIESLFVRADQEGEERGISAPTFILDQTAFRRIQSTETSQGLIALVRVRSVELDDVLRRNGSEPIVVLAGLQDPGNVGTIIRVAESFGARACIGLSGTVSIYNAKVVRASAGSLFRLPCVWNVPLQAVTDRCSLAEIPIVGTSPHAEMPLDDWDWRKPCALLIGNEGRGLNPDELRSCGTLLRIPISPSVESLNSAIATSVVLYESFRQRNRP